MNSISGENLERTVVFIQIVPFACCSVGISTQAITVKLAPTGMSYISKDLGYSTPSSTIAMEGGSNAMSVECDDCNCTTNPSKALP